MNIQTALCVEDDPKIRSLLRNVLKEDGFDLLEAATANEAIGHLGSASISLIILDICLGVDSGIDLAREIRKTSDVPIIMLTGRDDIIDRVVGLEVGADDYITKPFHIRELLARVRSVLRRANSKGQSEQAASGTPEDSRYFSFDGMTAFPDRLELLDRDGIDCGLTSGDFRLLHVFLTHPERRLSRDQLMDLTNGLAWSPLDRTIDNQISRLRKKIERNSSDPKLIKTVRGVGYMFNHKVQSHP